MTHQRIPPWARHRRLRRIAVIASAVISLAASLLVLFWDGCARSLVQRDGTAATHVGARGRRLLQRGEDPRLLEYSRRFAALDERAGGERR